MYWWVEAGAGVNERCLWAPPTPDPQGTRFDNPEIVEADVP